VPRYEYVTQSSRGAPFLKAFADAPSLAELNSRLIHLNKPVIKILDQPAKSKRKKHGRIPLAMKLNFLEQLEASCYLGMDFRTSLGICLETISARKRSGKALAAVVHDLREKVSRGMAFSRSIASYPDIFDEVAVGLISAGEEGGTFNESLTNVRKIWARNEDLRHRVLMMLFYPTIVFVAAVGVIWLLMTRVVPQFIGVLSEMRVDLPLPTRILVAVSQFSSQYPWLMLLVGIGTVVGMLRLQAIIRSNSRLHGLALRAPIFGKLTLLLLRANFSRTFSQLKQAKATTTLALILCRDLSWNYQYRSAVARALVKVQRGESLARAIGDDSYLFGDMIIGGLAFMEASGSDSDGLFRLTNLLERQLDSYINGIRQVLDPLLILLLGSVVAGIVFATFLPAIEILQKI
jgi:type II secretory pathway component PulF